MNISKPLFHNQKFTNQQLISCDINKPVTKYYEAYDTDLAKDNLENDIPAADLQDLSFMN